MNIYYDPKDFGLEQIDMLDDAGSYEFNMIVAWFEPATGKVYWGHDSGCSCPSPFEGQKVADLYNLRPDNYHHLEEAVDAMDLSAGDKQEFLTKVRAALRPSTIAIPEKEVII